MPKRQTKIGMMWSFPFCHERVLLVFEFLEPNSLAVRNKNKCKNIQQYINNINLNSPSAQIHVWTIFPVLRILHPKAIKSVPPKLNAPFFHYF